jgi:LacI family transcriptional regulator
MLKGGRADRRRQDEEIRLPKKTPPLRPTMADIARAIGVSQSCVSLALNDVPGSRLPEATRQRVREAAREMGYELPKRRKGRINPELPPTGGMIAYLVDEVSVSPHAVLHIDGARDAAWANGYVLQSFSTRSHAALEEATVAAILREKSLVGIIYAMSFTRKVELPPLLRDAPVVLVNCYTAERLYPMLLPGEVGGGFAMTQHLLAHGHRRIAMIGGEPWMDASRDRLKGYREALTTADIGFDAALVRHGDWSTDSGYGLACELLALDPRPTAFFCANDMMALGAINAIADQGLSVPDDISVVGYNDIDLARHMRPPLTSCRVPSYALGQRAVEMLLDRALTGKPLRPITIKLECQLVPRSSVAPVKASSRPGVAGSKARPS